MQRIKSPCFVQLNAAVAALLTAVQAVAAGPGGPGAPMNLPSPALEHDVLPQLTLTAPDKVAAEAGPSSAVAVLRRTGGVSRPLAVTLQVSGTAEYGRDYVLISEFVIKNQVVIPPGKATASVVVKPVDDDRGEEEETVTLTLVQSEPRHYVVGLAKSATITIVDNDESNRPPGIAIVSPADHATWVAPAEISLRAEGSDPDGEIVLVRFLANEKPIGAVEKPPFSIVWKAVPAGQYTVVAQAKDNRGAITDSKPVRITVTQAPPPGRFSAKINFQPSGARVPAGYLPDTGQVYGTRESGLTYGWAKDNRKNTRNRNHPDSPDQRYDTFAYLQKGDAAPWEMAVPKGRYKARVVAGDPASIESQFGIDVEGAKAVSGAPTKEKRWLEGTVNVEVTDGRLTVSNRPDAKNNKISFIEIEGEVAPQNRVSVEATDPEATEPHGKQAGNSGVFTLTRSGSTNAALRVLYRISGTASNGVDYGFLDGTATIAAGTATRRIVVEPRQDNIVEAKESVVLTLREDAAYALGELKAATVHIFDAPPAPANRPPLVTMVAPTNNASFKAPAEIRLTAQATDPDGTVRSVEFFAGDRSLGLTTNKVTSGTLQNAFTLVWTNVAAGAYELTARATDNQGAKTWSGPVRISVTAAGALPTIVVHASDAVATEPRDGTATDRGTFTFTRSGSTAVSLKVYYELHGTASNRVDYVYLDGDATIEAGRATRSIWVQPLADALAEGRETVILKLKPMAAYAVGATNTAEIGIVDPQPPVSITVQPGVGPKAVPNGGVVRITGLRFSASGAAQIEADAPAGQEYVLETSADLLHWIGLGQASSSSRGLSFTDLNTGESAHRFYRIRPVQGANSSGGSGQQ